MNGSTSRPFAEALQEIWAQMDSVCAHQGLGSSDDRCIGIKIRKPLDTKESLSGFCFLLQEVCQDATYSDAEVQLHDTEDGFRLTTSHLAWAKRLVAVLMWRGIEVNSNDLAPVNMCDLHSAREIQFGYSEWN